MQMTLRARFIDLLPVMVVFAIVTAFSTAVIMHYVVQDPLDVPPPQKIPANELPQGPAFHGSD
jgi:hypothetical protein